MLTPLPEKIDPWKLAADKATLAGTIPLRHMPRLTTLLSTSEGQVTVSMTGNIDGQKVPFLAGRIETAVEIICQRCLAVMPFPVAVEFCLGLIRSDAQAAHLSQEYDPLVVTEERISLLEVVEDELILALPLVPRHPEISQCEVSGLMTAEKTPLEKKTNPFAMLSTLLKDSKS